MALLEEQFTETLDAGAPDITYQGNEGKEQKIARQLWDQLPNEVRMQFGSFQQFFSSGAWKEVLARLQQAQQQGPERIQETETIQTQPQQGLGSMMPAQMAGGGDVQLASHESNDAFLEQQMEYYLEQGFSPRKAAEQAQKDLMEGNYQDMAYGGIAGADGRRQYGIGSWFQKKIMDPIKKNPLITAAVLGAGANFLPEGMPGSGWMGRLWDKLPTGSISNVREGLGNVLRSPEWMIPAASLVAGAFAKPEQQLEGGAMSRGAGINLQDIAKLANITDEKQGQAIGLNFLPEASARKYSPEEMALTYAATEGAAQGGRIGYSNGGIYETALMDAWRTYQAQGGTLSLEEFADGWMKAMMESKAQGGRIGAQEGGLMSLGGMEMDLRGGGFVPIGAKEKADDVPARLSKNEFVFTADAVRAAGGGDVDAGADKMYNTMKQLESRVG